MKYHYSLVRFQPCSIRGEQMNYAIIVVDDSNKKSCIRRCLGTARHRAFDTKDIFDFFLTAFKDTFENEEVILDKAFLDDCSSRMNNILTVREPYPSVGAEDIWATATELGRLFLYGDIE